MSFWQAGHSVNGTGPEGPYKRLHFAALREPPQCGQVVGALLGAGNMGNGRDSTPEVRREAT